MSNAPERLYRVTYALPTEPTVVGVVYATSRLDAKEKIARREMALGRGPIIRWSIDVEER